MRARAAARGARERRSRRDQQPGRAAQEREEGAFDQELARQPGAGGAERRADRELPAARGRTGEKQVGHVGARDQQYAPHGAEEDQEPRAQVAVQPLVQRDHGDAELPEPLGQILGPAPDRLQLRARFLERHPGPKPPIA